MNIKSIRFRLTVWYTLAFCVAAAVIFVSFYYITRQSFFSQTDSTLASHTQSIVDTLKRRGMHQMMIRELFLTEYSESPGMLVVIMDNAGNTVSSSILLNQTDQQFSRMYENAKTAKKPYYRNDNFGKIPMRYYIYPVYEADKLQAVVLMAHPMDVISQSLNRLLITLEAVFVLYLIPTAFGGYLLARGGLQPVSVIIGKLRRISSENLNEKIENPGTGDEIEELAHTFNKLLDRLNQAFTRERQFIADVAHELKTPLSTFKGSIEVALSKRRSTGEYRKVLSETIIDIDRLSATVNNILDLAWVESESTKNRNAVLDVSKLAGELKDFVSQMAHYKKISITGNIRPGIKIFGIKDKLERAFLNILDNAVKYTHPGGKISVTLQKRGDEAVFSVKDNGIGIEQTDLPHIFQRFYRGSGTDASLGSGLGLSISSAIISAHRGKIEVKSAIGQGTVVRVSLPRADKS